MKEMPYPSRAAQELEVQESREPRPVDVSEPGRSPGTLGRMHVFGAPSLPHMIYVCFHELVCPFLRASL